MLVNDGEMPSTLVSIPQKIDMDFLDTTTNLFRFAWTERTGKTTPTSW